MHGGLRPNGELGADAGVERRAVVPRFRRLVHEAPVAAEVVERLEHRRHAEVVVVLADRAGARLLEVRESGCHGVVVDRRRHSLGAEVVPPVTRGVGPRVGARGHHPERIRRARMRVADLRLRPPPGGGDAPGRRQVGDLGADERVDPPDHAAPVRGRLRRRGVRTGARSGGRPRESHVGTLRATTPPELRAHERLPRNDSAHAYVVTCKAAQPSGSRGIGNSTACDNGSPNRLRPVRCDMGMIGFDIACEPTRSGPRMQGYLVNDLCETITANKKQSDFALAA